ncbi:MAG TPA: type II toxin-antitoxin system VapC family toxin [Geminicoccaceae bacterium]|nr:type II toxin-antitoxin system VapC family toxin [Geminicoccaceae bacterium]
MIAVDTNVLVRFLVEDDVRQTDRAEAVLRSGAVLVPNTVLLETAWVLRTSYGFDRAAIADGITSLLGLPGVGPEDRATAVQALAWYAQGLDFADALHLATSAQAEAFATFDRLLRRRARAVAGTIPVVAP